MNCYFIEVERFSRISTAISSLLLFSAFSLSDSRCSLFSRDIDIYKRFAGKQHTNNQENDVISFNYVLKGAFIWAKSKYHDQQNAC